MMMMMMMMPKPSKPPCAAMTVGTKMRDHAMKNPLCLRLFMGTSGLPGLPKSPFEPSSSIQATYEALGYLPSLDSMSTFPVASAASPTRVIPATDPADSRNMYQDPPPSALQSRAILPFLELYYDRDSSTTFWSNNHRARP